MLSLICSEKDGWMTEKIQEKWSYAHFLYRHTKMLSSGTFLMGFFFGLLQINLQRRMRVTGLITQGAKRFGSAEYVKSYKVAYSDDGKTWRTYKFRSRDDDMVRYTPARKHCTAPPPPSPTPANSPTHTDSHHATERPGAQSRTVWRTWRDGFLIS